MAPRYVVPPRNTAYVAMLGLAVGSMVAAILMLAVELNGYDPVPAFQAVSLPKVEPRPAAPAPAGTPAAPGGSARVPPAVPAAPVAPPPAVAISPPSLPAAPAVAAAEPPKPAQVEDPARRGPRPGFNLAVPGQPPK